MRLVYDDRANGDKHGSGISPSAGFGLAPESFLIFLASISPAAVASSLSTSCSQSEVQCDGRVDQSLGDPIGAWPERALEIGSPFLLQ